ncbi:MAG: peptide chain release factor-like protein [bacterium]|nr:peptide chain release factor-like protein [bacterium]
MERRPPPYNTDPEVLEQEIEISVYRSSGPGGQHKNKTESAVRIHHPPSGVTVVATENRSQLRNRKVAMERLIERLEKLNVKRKPRHKTKIPFGVRERRLQAKKRRSDTKRLRGRPDDE